MLSCSVGGKHNVTDKDIINHSVLFQPMLFFVAHDFDVYLCTTSLPVYDFLSSRRNKSFCRHRMSSPHAVKRTRCQQF